MAYLLSMADAVRLPLPDRSVDLVFGSPPYIDARTYGIKAQRGTREWIDWMLVVTEEACRVSRGLVLWVCASGVRDHCYQPAPEGLLYEWWRRGGQCWRPAYWYRSGIPGSGGQHWLRADVEYVLAFLGPDRRPQKNNKGVWTDNTAMGKAHKKHHNSTKWASHATKDGVVSNKASECTFPEIVNPGNLIETQDEGFWTDNTAMGTPPKYEPGGNFSNRAGNGERANEAYQKPEIVNPGNLIKTNNGYGSMGSQHAHDNEAPFPEALAEFFIKTACKPGGIVLDPFSGSGTTVAVAERLGRHGLGLDIRRSQAQLAVRRITRPHSPRKYVGKPEADMPLFQ